jgi:hypothetical protein
MDINNVLLLNPRNEQQYGLNQKYYTIIRDIDENNYNETATNKIFGYKGHIYNINETIFKQYDAEKIEEKEEKEEEEEEEEEEKKEEEKKEEEKKEEEKKEEETPEDLIKKTIIEKYKVLFNETLHKNIPIQNENDLSEFLNKNTVFLNGFFWILNKNKNTAFVKTLIEYNYSINTILQSFIDAINQLVNYLNNNIYTIETIQNQIITSNDINFQMINYLDRNFNGIKDTFKIIKNFNQSKNNNLTDFLHFGIHTHNHLTNFFNKPDIKKLNINNQFITVVQNKLITSLNLQQLKYLYENITTLPENEKSIKIWIANIKKTHLTQEQTKLKTKIKNMNISSNNLNKVEELNLKQINYFNDNFYNITNKYDLSEIIKLLKTKIV